MFSKCSCDDIDSEYCNQTIDICDCLTSVISKGYIPILTTLICRQVALSLANVMNILVKVLHKMNYELDWLIVTVRNQLSQMFVWSRLQCGSEMPTELECNLTVRRHCVIARISLYITVIDCELNIAQCTLEYQASTSYDHFVSSRYLPFPRWYLAYCLRFSKFYAPLNIWQLPISAFLKLVILSHRPLHAMLRCYANCLQWLLNSEVRIL